MKRNLFLLAALFCLFLVFAACTRQPVGDSDPLQSSESGLSDQISDSSDRNDPVAPNPKTDENEIGWDDPVQDPISDSSSVPLDPSSSDLPPESTDSSSQPSEPPVHTESKPNTETNYSTVIK